MKMLVLLSALLAGSAHAQITHYTDQYGRPAGTAIQQGNMTFYTDGQGRPIGSAIGGQPPTQPQFPQQYDRQPQQQDQGYSGPNYSLDVPSPYTPDSLRRWQ